MTSNIIKSADAFSDASLPILSRDALIGAGALARLDFLNAYTMNGNTTLANGQTFKNMVDDQPDATYAYSTGTAPTILAGNKGINLSGNNQTGGSYFSFPAGSFDMHNAAGSNLADHNFIAHYWSEVDATGQPVSTQILFGARATDTSAIWGATPAPFQFQGGANATAPSAFTRANGGSAAINFGTPSAAAAHLESYAWVNGNVFAFLDGVQVASGPAPMASIPSMRSHATATAASNPADGDTITVNGTAITFKAVVTNVATQVVIGATSALTMANLRDFINANKSALVARAETGSATNIVNVFRQDANPLTLAASALTVSAITAPYQIKLITALKGTVYCFAMEDLTVSQRSAAASAAAEYAGYRAKLTAAGIA